MIYERIRNLKEITGRNACSLTWPLGSVGSEHRDYFLSKPYIGTHIHCQPCRKEGGYPMIWSGEICDGFLIFDALHQRRKMNKDEVETASLYSYQIPEYYGREIDEIIKIDKLGGSHQNSFNNNHRFVFLLEEAGSLKAIVPKKIEILSSGDGVKENPLQHGFKESFKDFEEKVVGLWYTNSNLEQTPKINIEDAWDAGMLTRYYPELDNIRKKFLEKCSPEDIDKYLFNPYLHPQFPREEIISTTNEVIREKLLKTSRKLSDIANGNFLAAYNLHEYLVSENETLEWTKFEVRDQSPDEFLDSFVGWAEESFPNVKLVWKESVPVILVSDKEIDLK